MRILNEKLDEYQELPRSLSEPRMKYAPSPDLRPEAIAEVTDDAQKQQLLMAFQQI